MTSFQQDNEHLYIRATTLEDAWSRFEPELSLPHDSPFYVARADSPRGNLERGLLLTRGTQQPKYFFAGHRGCGKSTELNRLVEDNRIRQKYWPVLFSVRDSCDFNDLAAEELLLAMGAEIFGQYEESGQRLSDDLLSELEQWKGRTVQRLTEKGAVFAPKGIIKGGAGFDISKFFLSALLKIKTEHVTREAIRQEIKPRRSELIAIINDITMDIFEQHGYPVLVVIEDLDKPPLDIARRLFTESFNLLMQPSCAIVYTIPVSLYFDPTYIQIREHSYFLPNVKLHPKKNRTKLYRDGWQTMRGFVLARMDEKLITNDALNEAVRMSGGVFRELAYIMQKSIDRALAQGNKQVQKNHVTSAAQEEQPSGFIDSLAGKYLEWEDTFRDVEPSERQSRIALREKYLANLPNDERAVPYRQNLRYMVGILYLYERKFDQAMEHLQKAVELAILMEHPAKEAQSLNRLGHVYDQLGKHDEAITAYQRAIALDATYAPPHYHLAKVYQKLGRHSEAEAAYQRAIALIDEDFLPT